MLRGRALLGSRKAGKARQQARSRAPENESPFAELRGGAFRVLLSIC